MVDRRDGRLKVVDHEGGRREGGREGGKGQKWRVEVIMLLSRCIPPTTHTHTCIHSPTHPLTHSPTHSLTHPPTHQLTHSPTHPPTHPPTHSLIPGESVLHKLEVGVFGHQDTASGEVHQSAVGRRLQRVLIWHKRVILPIVGFLDKEWPREPDAGSIRASSIDIGEEHRGDGGLKVLGVQLCPLCVGSGQSEGRCAHVWERKTECN